MEGVGSDGVKIYCLCRQPLGDGTMYGCDACDGWYHEKCIRPHVDTSAYIDTFICPDCKIEHPDEDHPVRMVTTYKRTCGARGCTNVADVKEKKKFCSRACALRWARGLLERRGREERGRIRGLLECVPEGMAQFTGAKPGAVPGIDIPLPGQATVEESPYWKRLRARWDDDDVAEALREEIKNSYFEDNAGYQHLFDKTVAKQRDIIQVVEAQREHTMYKQAFLAAAIRASKDVCKHYKLEHGMDKLPPIKGKPTMHNPPNDVCGYDYRLHANDAWHAAFKASSEGQAVLAGDEQLGLDMTGEIHTLGGVEIVDPSTLHGTICIKTKCRPHYDWASTAALAHKTAMEIYDEARGDAAALIAKMEEGRGLKMAVARLRANWMAMQLKRLGRGQLELLRSLRGEQGNGDLVGVFGEGWEEVLGVMPGVAREPRGDEDMGDGSLEGSEDGDESVSLEAARNERRNAKRRETRKAQKEKTLRGGDGSDGSDVEMEDFEEQD